MYASMKEVTAYCGEDFDANDPSRILRVVRDFMKLFEKAMADIKARPATCAVAHIMWHAVSSPSYGHSGSEWDYHAVQHMRLSSTVHAAPLVCRWPLTGCWV